MCNCVTSLGVKFESNWVLFISNLFFSIFTYCHFLENWQSSIIKTENRMTCSGKQEEALNDAKEKDGVSNEGRKLEYLDKTVYLVLFMFSSKASL